MSKGQDSTLFELVHSLSKAERKSFTVFSGRIGVEGKQYQLLFDLMIRQSVYDEVKLSERLIADGVRTPLPVLKSYLLENLLKVLRSQIKDTSVCAQIYRLLTDAEIMHQKGQTVLRDRIIRKAKRIANYYQLFELSLEVLNKEWFYKSIFNPRDIGEEYVVTLNALSRLIKAREVTNHVSILLEKGEVRDDELKKEWEQVVQLPLLKNDVGEAGYEMLCHYHRNWMRYYHRMNDFTRCVLHQELLVQHMESAPQLLPLYMSWYIFELNGLVVAYCQMKDYENAHPVIEKLRKIKSDEMYVPNKEVLSDTIVIAYANLIHGYYLSDFNAAAKVSFEAEKYLEANDVVHHHAAFLYLNLAKTNIYLNNFKKALIWTNAIFRDTPENRRDDFYVLAWVFNLIIHFEMNNFDFIPSLVKSTNRFLSKRKRLYKVESTIIKFLKSKSTQRPSKSSKQLSYEELLKELKEIVQDPYEAKALKYFDFILWLECKVNGTSVLKVVQ